MLVEHEGLSIEQAADALDINPTVAAFALKGEQQQTVTAQAIIDEFRCEGLNILKAIARSSDNDNAKVKAVKILLEGKGVMPEVNASELSQRFANMKRALATVTIEAQATSKLVEDQQAATANPLALVPINA